MFKPKDESFVVYADADFSGNWDEHSAEIDSDTARSRSGFMIYYLGCPIMWKSQLQTEIALSSTESEYICLSQALRKAIPIIELMREMADRGINVGTTTPTVKCTLFEDNSGALALSKAPAMRPRTKHINVKYHHFRTHVANGTIDIQKVNTLDQWADMLTKANDVKTLKRHRKATMGW